MCGFAGFVDPTGADDRVIEAMTRTLAHRGPDAEGFWRGDGVHLGHRRLSVIDLEASRQPMESADGRHVIVFNGEIYNFAELRAELVGLGHAFRTLGDTEVLLTACRQWGDEAVLRLRGMFAFAWFDRDRRRLLLARDHLGVKPLHWSWDGRRLLFASETKALLAHPAVSRDLDPTALGQYLAGQFVPCPRSAFAGVRKLPPASLLVLEHGGSPQVRRWWRMEYAPKAALTVPAAAEALEAVLADSVRAMLVSDVPLGAFLSGGVDSSTVCALMARAGARLRTFTVGFDDPASEHGHAAAVAQHLGAEHHCLVVSPDDLLGELNAFTRFYDEPFGDQAALPTLMLSRHARRSVTVVLTGEGADELLGGYGIYARRLREMRRLRACGGDGILLRSLARALPPGLRRGRLLRALARDPAARYCGVSAQFAEEDLAGLCAPAFLAAQRQGLRDLARERFTTAPAATALDRLLDVDVGLWLPEDLLAKVDHATMSCGLEARVPYLDHHVAGFCAKLPDACRAEGAQTKIALKALARRLLPPGIVDRPKSGFVMPIHRWLRGPLAADLAEALGPGGLGGRGIFHPPALDRLHARFAAGKANPFRMWTLFALEKWLRAWAPEWRVG